MDEEKERFESSGHDAHEEKERFESSGHDAHEEEKAPVFFCTLNSSQTMTNLFSHLLIGKNQLATITVVESGIKVTVEKGNLLRAKAYIKSDCFSEFIISDHDEPIEFMINLGTLLQCLQIFGTSASAHLQLSYGGYGMPVCVTLEEEGVITQCEIKTLHGDGPLDFNFRTSSVAARAIIKSQFLRDCFTELDVPGGEVVEVEMMQVAPFISLRVKGDISSCRIDFPTGQEPNPEVFAEFKCTTPQVNCYQLSLLRPCVKALQKSALTSLRVNHQGMLSMQHMVPTPDEAHTNWVEFLIQCQEDLE